MNAFIDAQGVLTSYGYAEANGADTLVPVADDFALAIGAWRWDGSAWMPHTPAPSWADVRRQAKSALDASDVTILRCIEHSVAVPDAWATYRAALRAIVSAATGDATQPLPARPAYPAGT